MGVLCAAEGIAVGLLAFTLFVCPWMGVAVLALHGRRVIDLILPVLFMGGSLCACYAVLRTHHF
jgi:hypothetical protein